MDTIDIEITPDIIARAHPSSPTRCYVALALREQHASLTDQVSVGMNCAYILDEVFAIPQPLRGQVKSDIEATGGNTWETMAEAGVASVVTPGHYTLQRIEHTDDYDADPDDE